MSCGSGWAIRRGPMRRAIPELPWLDSTRWTATPGYIQLDANAPASDRQSPRLHPRRLSPSRHHRRRPPGGGAADPDRAAGGRNPHRALDDRSCQPAAAFRRGGRLQRPGRPLAMGDVEAAVHRLYRCGLRAPRHRRARGRPQPGHLDLVHPPRHARDRDELSLPLCLRAQLPPRGRRDVAPALRGFARHASSRTRPCSRRSSAILPAARSTGSIDVTTDAAQLQVRRILDALIRAEQGEQPPRP